MPLASALPLLRPLLLIVCIPIVAVMIGILLVACSRAIRLEALDTPACNRKCVSINPSAYDIFKLLVNKHALVGPQVPDLDNAVRITSHDLGPAVQSLYRRHRR